MLITAKRPNSDTAANASEKEKSGRQSISGQVSGVKNVKIQHTKNMKKLGELDTRSIYNIL